MNTPHPADDSLIEGLARVVAVDRDQVWLVAEQPAACGSCATRSACGGGSPTKSAARWRAPRSLGRFKLPDPLGTVDGTSDQAKDHFCGGFWVTERVVSQVG